MSIFDPHNYYLNAYALPYFVVGVLVMLEGIFILTQTKKSILPVAYFLTALILAIWLTGVGFLRSASNEATAMIWTRYYGWFGICFVNPTIYMFSACWLDPSLKSQKKFIGLNYVIALVFYVLCIFTPHIVKGLWDDGYGFFPSAGKFEWVFILWFYILMTLAFVNFAKTYRREKEPSQKQNKKLMFIAFIIAFTGSVEYIPNYEISIFPIAYLPLFIFTSMMGYCVIRYQLMDIETVIHKTMAWSVTSIALIAPAATILYLTRSWFSELGRISGLAVSSAFLLGFWMFNKRVQPKVDRLFQRRQANLHSELDRFSNELVHLKTLEDLLQRSMKTLHTSLYARQISIYLFSEEDLHYVPACTKGVRDLMPVSREDPFIQLLKQQNEIVVRELAEANPVYNAVKDSFRHYFEMTQSLVVIPLIIGDQLIGSVNLGKKENLKKYSGVEVEFLTQIKSAMTIAISNSQQLDNATRLYQQVQTQNERLKELDRLKTEFLANTSHELRTPLNGILGLVEAIVDGSDGPLNDDQKKHLKMIIESGTNLKELINNLLELSRIESGHQKMNAKFFNILNVVDAVLALMGSLAQQKKLHLSRQAPASVVDVYGDPERIQRVLINLVGNAVKFTTEGEVIIRVSEAGGRVKLEVQDTGVGISETDQAKIFDRFRQADGSSTRQFEGTGLGLSIARELVREHGGDIEVESTQNEGSKFSFTLPTQAFGAGVADGDSIAPVKVDIPVTKKIDRVDHVALAAEQAEVQEEFKEMIRGNGETILVIDDNAVNREVVKARLQMNNYKVVEAVDGVAGLDKIKTKKPDLIVLDLMMPRMSGYEFCKIVRKKYESNEMPVLMLTAKTDMGDKIRGFSLGANDYIAKPFNQEELMARVGVLLKIHQMTQELKRWNQELELRVDERAQELKDTQAQLVQAEKMATIGILAGGVAHEINNPLMAVLSNVNFLKQTAASEDMKPISLIEAGAKRCQVIVNSLLKYSRKSEAEIPFADVQLNNVVDTAYSFLKYQLKQDNVEVICELGDVPAIKGIANELEQVMTNLLVNAYDAAKKMDRAAQIKIKTYYKKTQGVVLTISDNGEGISKANQGKIFDPFFTTKDIGGGTGLGLSVVYNIIQKHHGEVKVFSEEGVGTTFTVRIPRVSTR